MVKPTFWQGKRILVTGHTGFKGSWLSLWLKLMGAEVSGYALDPPTSPSLYDLAGIAQDLVGTTGDVRDFRALKQALVAQRPEIVLHLAAQALVRRSYADPVETYATNVMGVVHLLEAVRQVESVRAVVIVSSDKCYENREWVWGYREIDPLGGFDPYSSSKGCQELVAAAFRRSFFARAGTADRSVAVASARAGNVIGGGDWGEDRLIPDLMRAALAGEVARIRYPQAIRPWQHVLEPLGGYLLLAEKLCGPEAPEYAEAWNFGPGEAAAQPVGWVVERLASLWGDGLRWEQERNQHPHEAQMLRLDCSKARQRLGWRPRLDLEQTLGWTVEWYQAYQAGPESVRDMTKAQIRRYLSLEAA
jgi:CDP-glucose 4,6-dehydratase